MYERFTDRARKVMQLANQEAQRFNHDHIRTEHVLLGLVKEGSGVAANVLKNLDVDLRTVRREVEKLVPYAVSESPVPGLLPQTPRTKKVIEFAVEEARQLHHNYVGTEHLLLGLVREQEGVAAQVLMNLGVKLDDVREEVLNLLGHNMPELHTAPAGSGPPPALTPKQIRTIHKWIARLDERKEAFILAQEFDRAARCRGKAEVLKRLLDWYTRARGRG